MVTVASQSGHWRHQGGNQKAVVWAHTHLTLPVLARVFGYAPWSKISRAEDLPKDVALQWCRWCRDREYLFSDDSLPLERYEDFKAPTLAYSFADDDWGTEDAVDRLMSHYPNVERRHVVPGEAGTGPIGHLGYFRASSAALWHEAIDWLTTVD